LTTMAIKMPDIFYHVYLTVLFPQPHESFPTALWDLT
jgi:hypothetical protein